MKHKLLLTLPVALLLGCQSPEQKITGSDNTSTTMNTANDQKAIKDVLFAYRDALNASSTDQVIPLYTADGVFMPTGFPSAVGADQVRQAYDGVFANIKLSIEFFIDEVQVDGDHAFARTTSRGTTLLHATGATVPEENRELFVLQRTDGSWKIARYMFNKMK
jgi:uncharacterized protein (TIGR02246 family)